MTAVELPLLRRQGYVDGRWVDADAGATFPVVNPATGETIAEVPRMGAGETRRAIAAAERALPEWKTRPAKERARVLRRLADLMLENLDDLAVLTVTEQGKPLAEARAEVAYVRACLVHGRSNHRVLGGRRNLLEEGRRRSVRRGRAAHRHREQRLQP